MAKQLRRYAVLVSASNLIYPTWPIQTSMMTGPAISSVATLAETCNEYLSHSTSTSTNAFWLINSRDSSQSDDDIANVSGVAVNAAGRVKNETTPLVSTLAMGGELPDPLGRKRRVMGVGGGNELR
ncbi:hypothetical protein BDR22DRAFT_894760 [Usnea florida]